MKLSGEYATLSLLYRFGNVQANTNNDISQTYTLNFRNVLNSMYDKYDKFVIVHSSSSGWTNIPNGGYTSAGVTGMNANSGYVLGLSGLTFPFNTTLINNNDSLAIFPVKMNLGASTTAQGYFFNNYDNSNGIEFNKPYTPIVNISLSILASRTLQPVFINATSGNALYFESSFRIFGIEKD